VVTQFGLKHASSLVILAAPSLFLTVIHLGFASAAAVTSPMLPIVIAVLQDVATPGINMVGVPNLLQFVASFDFILW
jgi:solute carrier family 13 (sodium-dependent dicarboxylate transporter), member 2/3/5